MLRTLGGYCESAVQLSSNAQIQAKLARTFLSTLASDISLFPFAVIIETNKSTERIFPAVPDVENPEFFRRMDLLVKYNAQVRNWDSGRGRWGVMWCKDRVQMGAT